MLAPSMGEGGRLSKEILNLYVNLQKTEIVCNLLLKMAFYHRIMCT